jgi:flagellar biosynthetic protein FlhB
MAESDDPSQKTEQPTPRRLERAQEEGQVAVSREITHLVMISTLAGVLIYVFPWVLRKMMVILRFYLEFASQIRAPHWQAILGQSILHLLGLMAIPLGILVAAALASGFLQTRFIMNVNALKPQLSRVSPFQGFKRLLGGKAWVEFFKNILKLVVVASLAWIWMKPLFFKLDDMVTLTMRGFLDHLQDNIITFLGIIIALMTLVAIVDYLYQQFMFMRELRMTRQEIKEEFKEQEGDPHIKGRLRSLREAAARRRTIARVPEATVIITNPTRYAVALKYVMNEMDAPVVVAKGVDFMAKRIREIATEKDIPILENPPLARALYADVEVDQAIPIKYYDAVARIIRFVMGLDKHRPPEGI